LICEIFEDTVSGFFIHDDYKDLYLFNNTTVTKKGRRLSPNSCIVYQSVKRYWNRRPSLDSRAMVSSI
jgi:hypothetical protein